MTRPQPVWPDEVIGACTTAGSVICRACAQHPRRDPPEVPVYVQSTYCDEACESCGVTLADGGTYWEPPNFPDRHRGTRAPDPGFALASLG